MARMVNAVIGKKNKTWCDIFMLEAMPCLRITASIPGALARAASRPRMMNTEPSNADL